MDTLSLILRHRFLRDVVRLGLVDAGFSVASEASDLEGALALGSGRLDLVIVDAACCDEAPDAIGRVRQAVGADRIAILADEADFHRISTDHVMAADGLLTLGISLQEMIRALRLIQTGERVVSRELMHFLRAQSAPPMVVNSPPGGRAVSPREEDMLRHLVRGDSNKIIARELGIAEATVKVHLKNLMRKLSTTNRTQVAIWAQGNGFQDQSAAGRSVRG
jgi:two-component system nitrate/nitrite response regulator NarL